MRGLTAMRLFVTLYTPLLLGAATLMPAQTRPAEDVHVERGVMVRMRDGIRLATDLYRPAEGGVPVTTRLPALLQRTPYELGEQATVEEAKFFASHGYVVALQNIRGRYQSEGR